MEEHMERTKRRGLVYKEIDPECLKWRPFAVVAVSGGGS
jgi:histone acetyltransferase MYST2